MKTLLTNIKARPTYIKHHVLDSGRKIVIVKTTKGIYLHDGGNPKDHRWRLLANEQEIHDIFNMFYFASYSYDFINKD